MHNAVGLINIYVPDTEIIVILTLQNSQQNLKYIRFHSTMTS